MKLATLIHNVTYSKDFDCTPHEKFLGKVPDLSNFRIFGCLTYYLIAPELRQKLDPKCGVGFYLGPEPNTKGYRILTKCPNSGRLKVKIYRDIVTVEKYSLNSDLPPLQQSAEAEEELGPLGMLGTQLPKDVPRLPVESSGVSARDLFPPSTVPYILEVLGGDSESRDSHDGGGLMRQSWSLNSGSSNPSFLPPDQHGVDQSEPKRSLVSGNPNLRSTHHGDGVVADVDEVSPASWPDSPSRVTPRVVQGATVSFPIKRSADADEVSPASRPDEVSPGHTSHAKSRGVKKIGQVYLVNVDKTKCVKIPDHVAYANYASKVSENLSDGFAHKSSLDEDDKFVPHTYEEAMSCKHADKWEEAILSEFNSLIENGTWKLVKHQEGMKVLPCMWIFTHKRDGDGKLVRYKARLVAGGHKQVLGIDYDETFSPVSKYTTMRTILAVASERKWKVHQADVKTAFLHGDMDEFNVYMAQPKGFEVDGMVCEMEKCLYGLKQAPRRWNAKETDFFREIGFVQSTADPSLWILPGECTVYLCTVVDDMLITSPCETETLKVIQMILNGFPGTTSKAVQYSGLKITWESDGCAFISQKAHVEKVLERFDKNNNKMRSLPLPVNAKLTREGEKSKDVSEYAALIGSLLYIACSSRPDMAATVNRLAKYMSCPTHDHWKHALDLLGYLKNTINFGIKYGTSAELVAYCDSDYGGDMDNRRSHTGWVFMLNGGAICWQSKCQPTVAVSTVEAEYMAVASAAREALWLRQLLPEFGIQCSPIRILCDSMGAMASIKNPKITQRTKHIDIAHHFVRERHLRGEIMLQWIPGKENIADILTKPVPKDKHTFCCKGLGLTTPST